jgi:hypothetical protein
MNEVFTKENGFNFYPYLETFLFKSSIDELIDCCKKCNDNLEFAIYLNDLANRKCLGHLKYSKQINEKEYSEIIDITNKLIDEIFNLIGKNGLFSKKKHVLNYFNIFQNNKFSSELYFHKHIDFCLDVVLSYFNDDTEFEVYDEYETEYGKMDIFFENYINQTFDIVELKKDQITRKNIYQVYDYIMAIEKKFNTDINKIHGILIGSGIMENKDIIKLANHLNISIYKYEIESKFPLLVNYTLLCGKSNKYIEQTNGVYSDDVYLNYSLDDETKKIIVKIKKEIKKDK